MSDVDKLIENPESVKNKIDYDEQMKVIREQMVKKFSEYRTTINYMACDAPITILGLPKATEKILLDFGLLRVYDLFDRDFTEIKGLNAVRIGNLTSCLDKFFSML
jgi:hypothetical protein